MAKKTLKTPRTVRKTRKSRANRPGKDGPNQPLTQGEEAFCAAYARTGNGMASYREANPNSAASDASASALASRLLALVRIKSRIAALQEVQARVVTEKFEVDAEWLIGRFTEHADVNVADFMTWGYTEVPRLSKDGEPIRDTKGRPVVSVQPWLKLKPSAELSREQTANIAGIEIVQGQSGPPSIKVKFHDQQAALREIGKLGGHYKEKVQHEHQWIDSAAATAEQKFNRLIGARSSENVVGESDEGGAGEGGV